MRQTEVQLNALWIGPKLPSVNIACLLFQKRLGARIDTDVFVVRPLTSHDGYMMAWQDEQLIGSAVLLLPGGELTDFLYNFTRQTHPIPFWYSSARRKWLEFRKAMGMPDSTQAIHLWHHMTASGENEEGTIHVGSFVDQAFRMVDM